MPPGPPILINRVRSMLGIATPNNSSGPEVPLIHEMSLEDLIKEVELLSITLQHAQGLPKERDDTSPGDELETLALQFLDSVADRARKEKEYVESTRLRHFYSEKLGSPENDAKLTKTTALAGHLVRAVDECVLIASKRGISYADPTLYEIQNYKFPLPTEGAKNVVTEPIHVDLRLLKSPTSTFGLAQWGSGVLMSNMLTLGVIPLKTPVLDIGTGAGLVGITAAKRLAQSPRRSDKFPLVTLSDCPTPVLMNAKHNLKINGVDDPTLAAVVHLDWADVPGDEPAHYPTANPNSSLDLKTLKKYSTIIATDVIYDLETATQLPRVLALLLDRTPSARIYILIPARLGYDRPLEFFQRGMLRSFGEGEWTEVDGGLISADVWSESAMTDGFRLGVFKWDELQGQKL